jgi:endogenous inhibitor of DNA gyrase (YacG/DUF329 family)
MNKQRTVKCPTCGKPVEWSEKSAWRPFCSERCKLIDLGEWAEEGHRIAGEPVSPWEGSDETKLN